MFLSDRTYSKESTPFLINCLTASCRMRICLFLPLYAPLFATQMAARESQCREIVGARCPHIGISASRLLSHSASCPARSRAMNSDSIVDRAMQLYFADFHETAAPHNVKTYPLVEQISSVPLTQFASQYHSKTQGKPSKSNPQSRVPLRYLISLISAFQCSLLGLCVYLLSLLTA